MNAAVGKNLVYDTGGIERMALFGANSVDATSYLRQSNGKPRRTRPPICGRQQYLWTARTAAVRV